MNLRPEEISTLIKDQIKNYRTKIEPAETGTVILFGDGIAKAHGLRSCVSNELLEFDDGSIGIAQNLEEEVVSIAVLSDEPDIHEGTEVRRTGRIVSVPVGEALLGRVVHALGGPIDGKGPINCTETRPIEAEAPGIIRRKSVSVPLQTGIKAIDSMIPIGRGQRELIIGDRQTGKTSIAIDTIINQRGKDVICVYVAIGQKNSLVAQITETLQKAGAMDYTVIVCASASESAPVQYIVPYSGCAMAEYFREKGKDEWVLVENHHPAIVSPERQAAVGVILESKRYNKNATYQRKNVHVFAGLLTCGCCGSTMAATTDKVRADGWRPSMYICSRRRKSDDCTNKYVSDVSLGPFVLNFFANLIKASNSFGRTTSIETLEKKLLRGEALSHVDHIERPGLEELYNHLRSGFDEKRFEPPTIAATEASADLSERDLLLSEKRRLERALNRLKTIYLYGDDEMASKDFNIERERITKALSEVDSRINELDIANAFDLSLSDEAFMQKASQFILTQQLLDKRYVNYERFIRKIDPKIVKDFLNETVSNFCIKDGLTTSILLKNGIELRFSYKTAE